MVTTTQESVQLHVTMPMMPYEFAHGVNILITIQKPLRN